jgi:hypothetical protein
MAVVWAGIVAGLLFALVPAETALEASIYASVPVWFLLRGIDWIATGEVRRSA